MARHQALYWVLYFLLIDMLKLSPVDLETISYDETGAMDVPFLGEGLKSFRA